MTRLDRLIADRAYELDCLRLLREIQNMGDCNICKRENCEYEPNVGQQVRYNCPFYKGGE